MKFLITWTLMALAVVAFGATKSGVSTVDRLRQDLLHLEQELTKDLIKPKWTNVEEQQKYLYLIREYKKFGNRVDELYPLDRPNYLHALDSVWLWARAQAESKGVNGLYMVFRQMQRELVDMNAPVIAKQLANFAETILRDPNASIPRALDRIASLIVHENLFIAAYQVAKIRNCGRGEGGALFQGTEKYRSKLVQQIIRKQIRREEN